MTIHWWRKREVGSEGKEGEGKGEEKEGGRGRREGGRGRRREKEEEEGGRGRRRKEGEGGGGRREGEEEGRRRKETGSKQTGLCTLASCFPPSKPPTHTHTTHHTPPPPPTHTHTDDSDESLLSAGDDEPNGDVPVININSNINSQSSHQPIVHFEGSVREPMSPQEYNFTSKDDAKR